jgi:hypothetical protein
MTRTTTFTAGADLAMLLVTDMSGACGIAFFGSTNYPLGVVKKDCAESFHSFTHEVTKLYTSFS